jgi:hypothetical protein
MPKPISEMTDDELKKIAGDLYRPASEPNLSNYTDEQLRQLAGSGNMVVPGTQYPVVPNEQIPGAPTEPQPHYGPHMESIAPNTFLGNYTRPATVWAKQQGPRTLGATAAGIAAGLLTKSPGIGRTVAGFVSGALGGMGGQAVSEAKGWTPEEMQFGEKKSLKQKILSTVYQGMGEGISNVFGDVLVAPAMKGVGKGVMAAGRAMDLTPTPGMEQVAQQGMSTFTPQTNNIVDEVLAMTSRSDANKIMTEVGSPLTIYQLNPLSRSSKLVEKIGADSGPMLQRQKVDMPNAVRNLKDKFINSLDSPDLPSDVRGKVLLDAVNKSSEIFRAMDTKNHQLIKQMSDMQLEKMADVSSGNPESAYKYFVSRDKVLSVAEKLVDKQTKTLGFSADTAQKSFLDKLKSMPSYMTFDQAKEIRTAWLDISNNFAKDEIRVGKEFIAPFTVAMTDAMDDAAKELDKIVPGIRQQWLDIRKFSAEGHSRLYSDIMNKFRDMAQDKPEDIAGYFIGKDKLTTVKAIKAGIDLSTPKGENAWKAIRRSYSEQAIFGPPSNRMTPKGAPSQLQIPLGDPILETLQNTDKFVLNEIYTPQQLKDLTETVSALAISQERVPGLVSDIIAGGMVGAAAGGLATGNPKFVAKAGQGIAAITGLNYVMGELATHPKYAKDIQLALRTGPGTKTYSEAVVRLGRAVTAIQREKKNEDRRRENKQLIEGLSPMKVGGGI